jgi:outer membrane protein assembly factor BamB
MKKTAIPEAQEARRQESLQSSDAFDILLPRMHRPEVCMSKKMLMCIAVALCLLLPATGCTRKRRSGRHRQVISCMGGPQRTGVLSASGVQRLDALTWRIEKQKGIRACMVADDGFLYAVGSRDALHAFDLATGKERWAFTDNPVTSSPLVVDDALYIGTTVGTLYALNKQTGNVRWRFLAGRGWHHQIISPILPTLNASGDLLFFGNDRGEVYALDIDSGKQEWKFRAGGPIVAAPAADEAAVYIASRDGNLYARYADTGREKWTYRSGGPLNSSPIAAGASVLLRNENGGLLSLNAETGDAEWQFAIQASSTSQPAVMGSSAFITDDGGTLYAVDMRSGAEQWHFDSDGGSIGGLAIADGIIYFGTRDRHVYAISATSGSLMWQYPLADAVDTCPAVGDRIVAVKDIQGTITAFTENRP